MLFTRPVATATMTGSRIREDSERGAVSRILYKFGYRSGETMKIVTHLTAAAITLLIMANSALASGDASPRFTAADYETHVAAIKKKLPEGADFTVVVQPPFVVIGDESADTVRRRSKQTVKWAVD